MEKMKMHSPNLTQENIARIRELFPGCVTEAHGENGQLRLAVDFDQLRQELSESIVEGPQERYHLNWPGKREALLTANVPIAKTLRPCREESVDFDTTRNLFIEGDNLEALKLFQETYLGKVKMIYIDPPYNTGNDFIYEDDFAENVEEFLKRSNQKDEEGNRLIANTEANGRFHSDWLSMIYPRLKLARNLLQDDGVIFISIDDSELANLRRMCDEIFGESNFVSNIVWQSRTSISDDHEVSMNHNHTVIYSKDRVHLKFYGEKLNESEYQNRDNDPRGPWKLVPLDANKPGGNTHYPILNPNTGEEYWPPEGRSWAINPEQYKKLCDDNRIAFGLGGDSAPKRKLFLMERHEKGDTRTPSSIQIFCGTTKDGSAEVVELFGKKKIFSYPKPTTFISKLIQFGIYNEKNQILLDFFAGSATTAHAVMQLNAQDGGNRKFIMVQLPEPCDEQSEAFKAGYKTIAEISKERIHRAGRKIKDELTAKGANNAKNKEKLFAEGDKETFRDVRDFRGSKDLDIGFRVLKVDTSNMADVYYTPDAIDQSQIQLFTDNTKLDRTPEDLLFQVLLDWGVDLSLPIRKEVIQGKTVFFVNEPPYDLVACFDTGVNEDLVKELAGFEPLRVVFRDNGFASDAVKINVEQIFKQMSPGTEVKSI
ncbi:site-specific DNA-methyltransferase [Nitrosomonas mobilis]|uniref:site-specific DNA-methyltransferase (adenine-specific) n=1 Tax=Nitrosomonas mobilis TaxID=51642 RepID=A0A1G5SIK2_9PROT|nr:site-specific DNA-methyltransferase [Nitrosomonas mobilis]SCZ87026.1 Adenine specific DNA methylase Mod [Nitrosomonas mobilis]